MTLLKSAREASQASFDPEHADVVRDRIAKAQVYMLATGADLGKAVGHPFYVAFLQGLRYRETEDVDFAAVAFYPTSPTGELWINPTNCKNLGLMATSGLLVHEVLHVMLGHVHMHTAFRRRYPELFAFAVDLVDNQIVVKDGYQLPCGRGLLEANPAFDVQPITRQSLARPFPEGVGELPPPDQSVEFYCEWLLRRYQQLCDEHGIAPVDDAIAGLYAATGHGDGLLDEAAAENMDANQREMRDRFIAQAVDEAVAVSGGMSSLPGHLQAPIQQLLKMLEPKITLEQVLADIANGAGTMTRYNRRHRLNRYDRPGLVGRKRGRALGVVKDHSGSRSDREVAQAFGICRKVMRDHDVGVIIQNADYGTLGEPFFVEDEHDDTYCARVGCGGTNMRPAIMRFMAENEDRGEFRNGGVVVISDGELGPDSIVTPEEVNVPIVWLFSRKTMPFTGRRVAGRFFYFDADGGVLEELFP